MELLDWFSACLLQAKLGFNSRSVCISSLLKTFGATVLCIVSLCHGAKQAAVNKYRYLLGKKVAWHIS